MTPQKAQKKSGDETQINTGGGLYIGGDVKTSGGDFIGGNKNVLMGDRSISIGGNIAGSNIITGDGNIIGIRPEATQEDFNQLISNITSVISKTGLEKDTQDVIENDIKVLSEQTKKPNPNKAIILSKLKSIAEVITYTASSIEVSQKLLPMIHQAIQWTTQLFK